jgi:ATP-dependent DNA helicase RecG
VWNPGTLPGTLSLESLHRDHPSVPFNPLIAESLYLARYVEKAGSGTQRMIELCREAGLPEPDYELRQGSFVLTLWKDWMTEQAMQRLELNERQKNAISYLKSHDRLSNKEYQKSAKTSRATASRELDALCAKEILVKVGTTGRGTYYLLAKKQSRNDSEAIRT